ncbi:MAG: glycosyltransferase family 2 protein [Candidatus Buchananbacteria bacterium]|nr:glycosyltransferase family 2 protein [Candidatus Buchananbacteria bacterium]
MKLSFIIPAYNEENYIGKCIESILKEVKGRAYDVEIIVVNNASTDQTGKIARSFPGVIVVDEKRKGLSYARQAGFLASKGDLIANIDADTELTLDWIEKVLTAFIANPNLVALSGPYIYYDLSRLVNFGVRIFYYLGFIFHLINKIILNSGAMLQGGNFIVRRSALEKIGGYNLNFDFYGEDTDMACRLHKVGEVVFTFNLPMYTSGRRLAKEGILTMGLRYGINHFWTIFFKKPFTKKFIDIRK